MGNVVELKFQRAASSCLLPRDHGEIQTSGPDRESRDDAIAIESGKKKKRVKTRHKRGGSYCAGRLILRSGRRDGPTHMGEWSAPWKFEGSVPSVKTSGAWAVCHAGTGTY